MRHAGNAGKAARRMVLWTLVLLLCVLGSGVAAVLLGSIIAAVATGLIVVWFVFVVFTFYFFRDPTPRTPADAQAILAPACGKVDVIDEVDEVEFMGGRCKRVSVFMSIFDVHVQRAPVAGDLSFMVHHPGEFLNALNLESCARNENLLMGFESSERAGEKIGVRLIAGLIARRIVPWAALGDTVARGERLSLIQFGSRCDIYLPLTASIQVKLGDHAVAGQTVVALRS